MVEESKIKCDFCNKFLSNKYTLKTYQKNEQKCISNRSDELIYEKKSSINNTNTTKIKYFTCDKCGFKCTNKSVLTQTHKCRVESLLMFSENIEYKKEIINLNKKVCGMKEEYEKKLKYELKKQKKNWKKKKNIMKNY